MERGPGCTAAKGLSGNYLVIEPDMGGETVKKWLSISSIRERAKLISLGTFKDPSELYLDNPELFKDRFTPALNAATPWTDLESTLREKETKEAFTQCRDIASSTSILDLFAQEIERLGVSGESQLAKLLFLIMVSRYLKRPVSSAVKGPSAGGKSYLVECLLRFSHLPLSICLPVFLNIPLPMTKKICHTGCL